jgi:hypothetical protein
MINAYQVYILNFFCCKNLAKLDKFHMDCPQMVSLKKIVWQPHLSWNRVPVILYVIHCMWALPPAQWITSAYILSKNNSLFIDFQMQI